MFTFALFETQELHRVGDAEPVEGAAAGPARGPRHGVRQRGRRQRHLQKVPRGKSLAFYRRLCHLLIETSSGEQEVQAGEAPEEEERRRQQRHHQERGGTLQQQQCQECQQVNYLIALNKK